MTFSYLKNLKAGKIILWCYLIWYCVIVAFYFDPDVKIWLNSLGISAVIGFALTLSVASSGGSKKWQTFRLFAMPFGVSSYSALIKGKSFLLIVPPNLDEFLSAVGSCVIFLIVVFSVKYVAIKTNA